MMMLCSVCFFLLSSLFTLGAQPIDWCHRHSPSVFPENCLSRNVLLDGPKFTYGGNKDQPQKHNEDHVRQPVTSIVLNGRKLKAFHFE